MSTELHVGQIITGLGQKRDAIHIALTPAVCRQKILRPGQHVGKNGTEERPHVGIVDPYLRAPVLEGQEFWLFLYPNTVTSLRHEWTHTAFEE